jgi:hypothetical protein
MITRRVAFSSVSTVFVNSSFSTLGCSVGAAYDNPVQVFMQGLGAARLWISGSSGVTTATGLLVSSNATTMFSLGQGEALFGITSAAVTSTFACLYTNQPV